MTRLELITQGRAPVIEAGRFMVEAEGCEVQLELLEVVLLRQMDRLVDRVAREIGAGRSEGGDAKRCSCGRRGEYLCDYALTGSRAGETCDRPLCPTCATEVGPDRHYCGPHARMRGRR